MRYEATFQERQGCYDDVTIEQNHVISNKFHVLMLGHAHIGRLSREKHMKIVLIIQLNLEG